jgi:hypothetical protein
MNPQKLPLWILWFGFLSSVFFLNAFLGGGEKSDSIAGIVAVVLLVGPISASTLIRWIIIPKMRDAQAVIPFFVIGMALAESLVMFGCFLVPSKQSIFAVVAALGVIQYIPIFIKLQSKD